MKRMTGGLEVSSVNNFVIRASWRHLLRFCREALTNFVFVRRFTNYLTVRERLSSLWTSYAYAELTTPLFRILRHIRIKQISTKIFIFKFLPFIRILQRIRDIESSRTKRIRSSVSFLFELVPSDPRWSPNRSYLRRISRRDVTHRVYYQ